MNVRALPSGLRRFALADLPTEPWRNGGGRTRTVAAAPPGSAAHWRVSVADITQDGPFSVFDAIDRTAVLLRGPGLTLAGAPAAFVFDQLGDRAAFAGESALHARLGEGPARLWNVMVARAQLQARVEVHAAGAVRPAPWAPAVPMVLMVLSGALQVALPDGRALLTLQPEEGLVLSDPCLHLGLEPLGPGTRWIDTTLHARCPG